MRVEHLHDLEILSGQAISEENAEGLTAHFNRDHA